MTIPRLSLTDFPDAAFVRALRAGLEKTGFAVIRDHGVPQPLVDATYAALRRLFALPDAEKAGIGSSAGGARGYTAFAIEHAKDSAIPDLKEFFHVGRHDNRWPVAVPELERCCVALFAALEDCSRRLLEAIEAGYSLPHSTLAGLVREGNHVLRGLHYPPVPDGAHPGALRAAPHEDINLITLLCEASDAGLEILRSDGRWLPVESSPGEIVVDAGDMLARLTNGVIPATTHRVVRAPEGAARSRYSLPFFAHPRPECDLSVLPAFVSPGRPARTPPITAGAWLEQRLKEIGLGNP